MTSAEHTSSQRPVWLFVDGAPVFGGHEVMLLRWLEELDTQHRVIPYVLARERGRLLSQASVHAQGIALSTLPITAHHGRAHRGKAHRGMAARWQQLKQAWADMRALMRVCRQLQPQWVIVAEGCLLAQWHFTLAARLLGMQTMVYVPLIEPASNMGFASGNLRDWLVRHVYRHLPKAWLTLTPGLAQQLQGWSRIAHPIFTLPNALAPSMEYLPLPAARTISRLRVLVLGRLDHQHKGLDALLDHLCRRPELAERMQVSFVGEGPYGVEIARRLRAQPQLQSWIALHPWGDALQVMREHDVLLLPSRYEGVPLVVLEAMAAGLPVVATKLPGIRHLLPPECTFGREDMAAAIDAVLATANLKFRQQIITRNYEMMHTHASGAAFAEAVKQLTDTLLALDHAVSGSFMADRAALNVIPSTDPSSGV